MEQLSFDNLFVEEKYLTVSELTREIKVLLESRLPQIWVKGEISNFSRHSSGHIYFSLKDENAQISCVMWRSRNFRLFFTPQDGMKVVVQGWVTVYEKRGSYQLDVLSIHPAGVGELQMAFDQLKRRLYKEGLFDEKHKQPIPRYPERIGIVTSATGAAVQDLVTILGRRFPGLEIILNPVRVQGDGAAQEIARAIDQFNQYGKIDVLIVGRGGGSLEDLWPFNEEVVARAVFRSRVPVISAVGHEVDFSICDFVADLRAPTPSAAAEMAVCSRDDLLRMLNKDRDKMSYFILEAVRSRQQRLKNMRSGYAFRQPEDVVKQYYQRLDEVSKSLMTFLSHRTQLDTEKLNGLRKRLEVLDHRQVLKRGYSLVHRRSDGHLIKKSSELETKDALEIEFSEGRAIATVDEIKE